MDGDQDVYLPSAEDQHRALAMVKRIAESTDEDSVEFVHCLRRMQKAIRMARSVTIHYGSLSTTVVYQH